MPRNVDKNAPDWLSYLRWILVSGSRSKAAAAWFFGSLLLSVLIFALFSLPNPTPDQRAIVRFLMALTAGLFGYFFGGTLKIHRKVLGVSVDVAGGFALFCLAAFVFDPFYLQRKVADVAPGLMRADERTREAQEILASLGYRVGPAQGVRDSLTMAALRDFQTRHGLQLDPYISDDVLGGMHEVAAGTIAGYGRRGRIEGALRDRQGRPLSALIVSVEGGPETVTDAEGRFVLTEVAGGDRTLIVKSRSGSGELRHNVAVSTEGRNSVTLVYDVRASCLGLLSIVSPVDGGTVEVREDGKEFRATVYGRCDGLPQILDRFDIWVLIHSERDSRFWVQAPPAVVDRQSNTWRADVLLGSPESPPRKGECWYIVAVAAEADSEMRRITNTPSLSLLPRCVQSNVVTVETAKKR